MRKKGGVFTNCQDVKDYKNNELEEKRIKRRYFGLHSDCKDDDDDD